MPIPGDQHKSNGVATANPFEDTKPTISEYTAQEIATLQSRLNKRLGPEYISTRPGPGNQKIAYLSAEKAINLANEVFGFNGWSSSIQNIQVDFIDENPQTGKITLGLSVVVRVTLKDGTYHEDIGYGGIEGCKSKFMAFEKSKKEATTDALKRALRNFGNVLGNCMYDRDFVTKVSKIKPGNGKFDVNELHRHPDFASKTHEDIKQPSRSGMSTSKTPSLEFEDSFDVSEFDDIDFTENDLTHSEEIILPAEPDSRVPHGGTRSGGTNTNTPSKAPQIRPQGAQLPGQQGHIGLPANRLQGESTECQRREEQNLPLPQVQPIHFTPQQAQPSLPGVIPPMPAAGFYSAKAAKNIDQNNFNELPTNTAKFNPHAESPSIRKTAGVDHSKSVPVRREMQKVDPSGTLNTVDPRGDPGRKIGLPGQPAPGAVTRPAMSTSAYRPPTRYGSPTVPANGPSAALPSNASDRGLTAAKRHPLGDVSNVQHSVTALTSDGGDAKRQKITANTLTSGGIENDTTNHDSGGLAGP